MISVKKYIESNKDRFIEELFSLIRIPSISAKHEHKPDMEACAKRWTELLLAAGADKAVVMQTEGNPVVYGEKMVSPEAQTVLVYSHYDVMPAEPFDQWKSRPFEPEIRDGRIWARGADDDKGQAMMQVKGFETALSEELTTRANTAANIITTGANTLGVDSAEVQAAQAALDDFSACLEAVQNGSKKQSLTSLPYYQGSAMHALCQANEALGTVIDQLYAKMQEQAADPMKMGAVQGQYGQFNSAGTIIGNLQYNDAVYEYQNDVGGFPASMLGRLFGVQEVEPFA